MDKHTLQKARLALFYKFVEAFVGMETLEKAYLNSVPKSGWRGSLSNCIQESFFGKGAEDYIQSFFDDSLVWVETGSPFGDSTDNSVFWAGIDTHWKNILSQFDLYIHDYFQQRKYEATSL